MGDEATEPVIAVNPGREVAGAAADDRVGRQMLTQPHHDLAEIDAAWLRARRLRPCQVVLVRNLGGVTPGNLVRRLDALERCRERGGRGIDGEVGSVQAPE